MSPKISMKYDFITIGGVCEDQFIYTKEGVVIDNKKDLLRQKLIGFEYGAKVLVDQAENSFGGGSANAAIAFARLGFKTSTVVAIGKDARGSEIIKNFKQNKVGIGLVQKIKDQISGYSAIIVAGDKEHVAFPVRGANHYLVLDKSTKKEIAKSEWLYLTSLSGDWQTTIADVFSNKGTAKVVWNPGHVQLSAGLKYLSNYLRETQVLIVNIDEARELLMSAGKTKKVSASLKKIEDIGRAVKDLGPKMVVITDGSKGACVITGDGKYAFKPEKISNALNTVGVGDAFGSTFIAGLKMFDDVDKALALAGRNSARVVRSHGAQIGLLYKKQV